MKSQKRSYQLYIHIVTIFLLISITLSGLIIYRSYHKGIETAFKASDQLFAQLQGTVTERINRIYDPMISMVTLTVTLKDISKPIAADRSHPLLNFLATALDTHPNLYALYMGFENGDFFEVARLNDKPAMKTILSAPKQTHYGVMTIIHDASGTRRQVWTFLNRDRQRLGEYHLDKVDYDPRTRPWYRLSIKKETATRTKPYIFAKLKQPGITFAHRFKGASKGVFGVDISLATLSKFLAEQQFSPSSTILFFDKNGTITGYPDLDKIIKTTPSLDTGNKALSFATIPDLNRPDLTALFNHFKKQGSTEIVTFSVAGRSHIGAVAKMPIKLSQNKYLGIVAPLDEFLGPIHHVGRDNVYSSALIMLITTPIIWWVSRRISRPLGKLTDEISKVEQMNLDTVDEVSTQVQEIQQLSRSFNNMILSLKDYQQRLMFSQKQLRMLVEIGISLANERDYEILLENILRNGQKLSHADGGTVYLIGEDDQLHYKIVQNDTLKLSLGGQNGGPMTLIPLPFAWDEEGNPKKFHIAPYVAQTGKTIRIDNVYDSRKSEFPGMKELDEETGYHTVSILTVPIKTQRGEVVGILQLINAQDPMTQEVISFDSNTVDFIEALAAQAAIAIENQHLIEVQAKLFNAFIQMIATAIDTKSPYTGGHCARVPVLARLLSEAASESEESIFSDFRMTDEDRYAINLASWLHDCGKIATPEYIVDKATKLETIYNRIHEVRTRFEILRRDAEINYLQELAIASTDAQTLFRHFEEKVAALHADFAFIAECNIGTEFLDDDKKERVHHIAKQTWTRHFDDRLGLALHEQNRLKDQPIKPRPSQEFLLDNKEEHKIKRRVSSGFRNHQQDGINVEVPELMQNTGEIYNLCIERGTLTAEDRHQIVEHIILTIRMLEKLPFPKHLRAVPEYASGHHETMIGTGYPRKLTREQMSIPARIMAIADIFEALTASDRPYKKAKTLNEAIRIMGFMAKDQHIDGDLFQLFLEKEIYLQYAHEYLNPEQIDTVAIASYLKDK